MSSSPARRRRLIAARTFPQAFCTECGADLSKVPVVSIHLARCQARARAEQPAKDPGPIPLEPLAPSWWERLRGALGIHPRGASR